MRVLGWVLFAVVWVTWMVTVTSVGSPGGGAWSTDEVLVLGGFTAVLLALAWLLVVEPIRSRRS